MAFAEKRHSWQGRPPSVAASVPDHERKSPKRVGAPHFDTPELEQRRPGIVRSRAAAACCMKTGAPNHFGHVGIVGDEWIGKRPDRSAETLFQVVTRSRNLELARFCIRDVRE